MGINGIVFLVLMFLFSGVNSYLLHFAESGRLPTPIGYNLFAKIAHICIAVMTVWNFGWIIGIAIFLLHLFNLVNAAYSWIITYRLTAKDIEKGIEPELNQTIYGLFSFLVLVIVISTVISFYTGTFENMKEYIEANEYKPVIAFLISGVIGFFTRIALLKKLSGKNY